MQAFRQSLYDADPKGQADWFGWVPGIEAAHCEWHTVTCDADGYVEKLSVGWGLPSHEDAIGRDTLSSGWDSSAPVPTGAMLPDLARMSKLTQLFVLPFSPHAPAARPLAAIPKEWVQPGAFPSLLE